MMTMTRTTTMMRMTMAKGRVARTRVAASAELKSALLIAACLTCSQPAAGQSSNGGSGLTAEQIVRFLVTNRGVQTSSFDQDQEAAAATSDTLTRALLSSLATLPVSTSSSGFTYRLNPTLGTVERASETFGPFFVERAVTAGAGQASFGATVQVASFRSLDGHRLRTGELVTTSNRFVDEAVPFDVETLTLAITTKTATIFGNVGVTDRIDVGVAVPLVRLDISGSRINTYRGQSFPQARAQSRSVGLADVAVRTKVRLTPDGPSAVAAGAEVRLPTGRQEDLLGAGDASVRLIGLASTESRIVSLHGNVAVGLGGLGREISYGGAVAFAARPRVTIVGEAMARRVRGLSRVTFASARHPRIAAVTTTRLLPEPGDQLAAFVVGGVKWNVGDVWLVHANVLMPLTDSGLTARVVPAFAIDYSFTR
jgi:hypothetical protein